MVPLENFSTHFKLYNMVLIHLFFIIQLFSIKQFVDIKIVYKN